MAPLQSTRRRAYAAIAVLALASLIAACHSHDDDDGDHGQPPPVAGTPNPPPATTDSFVTYVTQVVATADETSEPASIDGVAVTTPDATEPQTVAGS